MRYFSLLCFCLLGCFCGLAWAAPVVEFSAQPAKVVAGQASTWTLAIRTKPGGALLRDFAIAHEKPLHLIVVSSDLAWFNHLHPTPGADGRFSIFASAPRAGNYRLFADFTKDGEAQTAYGEFNAAANPADAATRLVRLPLTPDKVGSLWLHRSVTATPEGRPDAAGGAAYHVELAPGPWRAGQDVKMTFRVLDNDLQPVAALQPYLGSMGHLVVISADAKNYIHAHALKQSGSLLGGSEAAGGAESVFHVKFPAAGVYKMWTQFQHGGALINAPFVVEVAAPDAAVGVVKTPIPPSETPRPAPLPAGKTMILEAGLTLRDLQGRVLKMDDWRGRIPLFVFADATCPCVPAYDSRMKAMHQKYSTRGLRLVYVFASREEKLDKVKSAARSRAYPWPVVHDADQSLLRRFDARCTTEAFLFGTDGALRYHGRIDVDTFEPKNVKQPDLENALRAVLAGQSVARAETKVWACELRRR